MREPCLARFSPRSGHSPLALRYPMAYNRAMAEIRQTEVYAPRVQASSGQGGEVCKSTAAPGGCPWATPAT